MLSKKEYTELYKQYGLTGSEIAKRLESFGSSNAVEVTFIMTGTGYSLESKGVTVDEGRAESSVNTCAGEENTKNNSSSSSEESKPEPLISGLYNSSWKNLGYRLRNLDRAIDGRTNKSGQAPGALKFIAELNPLVSIPNAVKKITTGENIYHEKVSDANRYISSGTTIIFAIPGVGSLFKMTDGTLIILNKTVNEATK